jgi:hypothetical protein
MSELKTPFWKNTEKIAIAAGMLATIVTALALSMKKTDPQKVVRPIWDERYEEESLGV